MKKIIAVLLLFVSLANADYQIMVNSPEEVDSMFAILNAVAEIFQNDNYTDLLRLMFLFGGFVAFYSWVIGTFNHGEAHSGGANFTKFNIGAVALLILVFSVQTSVWVKSEHFPKYYDSNDSATYTMGVKVDNIPEIAAYGMYFLNSFGRGLEDMYQTAMTPIGNYSLADGGYVSTLRDDFELLSMKLGDTDKTLGKAVDTVISQCIFIPFSAKGAEGMQRIEEIRSSNNIKKTLDDWYANGVSVGGIKASDYLATFYGEQIKCGDLWDYIKNSLLTDYNEKAGKYLNNLDSRDLEMITGLNNVPKSDFDEIAIQAGIVNSVIDNKDIGAGVSYASGKTQAEFVQQNLGAGYYMAKMLPIMQSLFRAIIYALFPAIVAISLLPGGWQILKNYVKTAVWIELWGVIAAILNFFILKYGEHTIAGDITAYSASKMLSETSALAGMAGYLYLMVPGIAWGLMSGSFNMLEGLGRGVAAGLTKNMSTGSYAQDAKKLQMKESASMKAGKDFSFAEAMHFQQLSAGIKEGTALGAEFKQGKAAIASLADYSTTKQFKELQKKEEFLKLLGKNGGVENIIDAETDVSAGGLARSLGDFEQSGGTEKMYNRGKMGAASDLGKLDTVGVKGSYDIAAGSSAKSLGEVETAGVSGMHGAGRHAGRADKAHAGIEKKHGAAITSSMFNKENEDIVRTNSRINTLKKEVGNVDSYFKTDTKQNVQTQEIPSYLRNDRDGDGKVSDTEIGFEKDVNTIEAKKGVINKFTQQQQELKNAEKNRASASKTVRDAQEKGENLVAGLDDKTKAIIGASAAKAEVGTKVENANQRKDSRVLEQLGTQGKDMEDTAVLDSKRLIGDLSQVKTQTDTTGGLIKDLVQKKSEIREAIGDKLDKNMSYGEREEAKDKILMHSMAKVGIADGELTQRNLSRDVQKVQAETQSKLKAGLVKAVGKENLGTLKAYNTLLQNREDIAQRLKDNKYSSSEERARDKAALEQYDKVVIPQFENSRDMQSIKKKIEAYNNSSEAQRIVKHGQQKLEQTYRNYESIGLIKRDSNGNVQVADTSKTIDALHGEQKALYVEKVKRSLDGLKTSTVGIDGMQLERVDNILGEHTTERATATQEWSKNGRFNNDIQYHAVSGNYIKPENMATINTGANSFKDVVGWIGVGKFLKGSFNK